MVILPNILDLVLDVIIEVHSVSHTQINHVAYDKDANEDSVIDIVLFQQTLSNTNRDGTTNYSIYIQDLIRCLL